MVRLFIWLLRISLSISTLILLTTVRYFFGRDFIPCLNKDRFAVFHNGRLLSKDMYRVIVPEVENTATEVCVHLRRIAQKGDRVDIFYLPYDFNYTDIGKTKPC